MPENSKRHPTADKKPLRVLLVEDDEEHINLVLCALNEYDSSYETTVTTTGHECLSLLKQQTFDVVLLDYRLPDLDGITILREAKKIDTVIPFVMVTGGGSEAVAVDAMKLGAFDYLVKTSDYYNQIPKILENLPSRRLIPEPEQILTTLFRVETTGADVAVSEEIGFSDDQERFLLKMGVFYMTLLGQIATESDLGIYGPLPVAGYPEYRSLVYVFAFEGKKSLEIRRNDLKYWFLVFFIPQDLVGELPKTSDLKKALDKLVSDIESGSSLGYQFLKRAKGVLRLG